MNAPKCDLHYLNASINYFFVGALLPIDIMATSISSKNICCTQIVSKDWSLSTSRQLTINWIGPFAADWMNIPPKVLKERIQSS
jgi:hypothetical protein